MWICGAYYDEKDIVKGANVRLVKLAIRLQVYNMYVVGIIHGRPLDWLFVKFLRK